MLTKSLQSYILQNIALAFKSLQWAQQEYNKGAHHINGWF
jgi:hypothetical protein